MSTKTRATKPQPKPMGPLEKLVRDQIATEYLMTRAALEKAQNTAFDGDAAARLARVQAAIRGESVGASPDPLAGVPEADSGEALVRRWCVVWDDGQEANPIIGKVTKHDPDDPTGPYLVNGDYWRAHASPIELGVPEAIRKAVEG